MAAFVVVVTTRNDILVEWHQKSGRPWCDCTTLIQIYTLWCIVATDSAIKWSVNWSIWNKKTFVWNRYNYKDNASLPPFTFVLISFIFIFTVISHSCPLYPGLSPSPSSRCLCSHRFSSLSFYPVSLSSSLHSVLQLLTELGVYLTYWTVLKPITFLCILDSKYCSSLHTHTFYP